MRIYTSYFAKLNQLISEGCFPVSIARFSPGFFKSSGYPEWKHVAPTEDILKEIKKSFHTEKDKANYSERYIKEVLDVYKEPVWLLFQLQHIVPENIDKVVLLCYEKPDDFCHRHLLSNWLNEKLNLDIREYQFQKEISEKSLSEPLF